MSEEALWDKFRESGAVLDYLQFVRIRGQEGEYGSTDGKRSCTEPETGR